ncbi:MAG: LysR family transcriptional regulator [Myxococcales bacterium]|nr:LysR family transcriptional regulator [Myxococcales bacterium]
MAFDRLEDLRTFALVVDGGSLSSAARALQLTTNAVSRRILRLEAHAGVRLLHRTTRRLGLTEEGRILYARCARIVAELDAVEEELHPSGDSLQGVVRLALPPSAATANVLEGMARVMASHPRLSVQLQIVNAPVDPISGGVDIVLHVGPLPDSSLVARPLATRSWVLAASPAYLKLHGTPRKPTDLASHQCLRLLGDRPQRTWDLIDHRNRTSKVRVGGTFECDDSRVLGDAIHAGLGIGVRPDEELARGVASGTLARVLPEYRFGAFALTALVPPGRLRIPRIGAFVSLLRDAMSRV